ncbi:MAG TPA: ABC transporter permease [Candidatus Sulfopaludibacter sp.]|jgi:predicted permease|nr:ABC transporter permease [Candidatus Sulfopaludibacter sp.]
MNGLLNDLRYTFRTLRRDSGFATFAIIIVGLGIGASATLFSVVNALLLQPLPFHEPARLVWITNRDVSGLSGQTSQVNHLLDLREKAQSFSELGGYFAFYGVGDSVLSGEGEPERLSLAPVTGNFFPLLGVQPILGRNFNEEECKWRGPQAVLLSYGFWQRRFAGDRTIVGRNLILDAKPVSVIGVLPASFDFSSIFAPGSHIDLFGAFPLTPETNRWGNTLAIVGRLRPGISVSAAGAEVRILAGQITAAHPEANSFEGHVTALSEHVSGRIRLALFVLAGAVGVVMLIVCANLSNLLLARTASRQKEIAIRTALGAAQGRLVRQMLTEGVTLSGCGAALGLLLALAGTRAVAHLDAISLPLLHSVRLDSTALVFSLLMALGTGIVFGLAPAISVKAAALHDALKDTGRGTTEGKHRQWIRSGLVVTEVAFACVLLVGAGLLIRSFLRVLDVNLGFRPERAAHVRVDPARGFDTQEAQNAYFDDVLRRAKSVPGVTTAGLTDALPLGRNRSWGVAAKGQTYPKGKFPVAYVRIVSDGYIGAMGIALRAGRDLSERDTNATEPVMLINETMARTLFPGQNAVGQLMRVNGDRRVVGIVSDVRHLALEEGSGMEMYLPLRQSRDYSSVDLVIRTSLPPDKLAPAVRAALQPIAPTISGSEFGDLQQLVDKAVSPRRFVVLLLGSFALFALVLASLGIYGVISYSVGQRTQEIGIRMALGASAGSLEARILGQTLGMAAAGILLGSVASWILARSLSGLLYGVTTGDPLTFAGMLGVLLAVSAVAGYLPARRASRIDPSIALRAN